MADQVWITEVGGARIVQVPSDAIVEVSRSSGRGLTATASVSVKRLARLPVEDGGGWLAAEFVRVEREIQIVEDGQIVFWGPILSVTRQDATRTVGASSAAWWLTRVLIPTGDPVWSNEWLVNPNFESELSGWTVSPGPVSDSSNQETGSFCVDLLAGWISQEVAFSLSPEWKVRVQARVWVASSVPDDDVVLRLETSGTSYYAARQATAGEVTRDEWGWLVRDIFLRNPPGGPGTSLKVQVFGSGSGTVLVDRVSMQVSAESLGIPDSPPRAKFLTQQVAFQSVVNAVMGEEPRYNLTPTADTAGRVINAPWADRRDVFASEGLRQLVEAGDGVEWNETYDPDDRFLNMRELIGTEHDPETLTLEAGVNVRVVGDWTSGTATPVTEWLVMDEEGFIGSYRDNSGFDGLLLQELSQAPIGTATSELEQQARKRAVDASEPLTDVLTLGVDRSLVAVLGWGDRVWLLVDDGPDSFDGWVRVESVSVVWGEPTFQVTVSRWEGS